MAAAFFRFMFAKGDWFLAGLGGAVAELYRAIAVPLRWAIVSKRLSTPIARTRSLAGKPIVMRRLLLAVLYLAMIPVGISLSLHFFLSGGRSIIFASIAFTFGAFLFWTDFFSRKGQD
jgi:hypothetical protein